MRKLDGNEEVARTDFNCEIKRRSQKQSAPTDKELITYSSKLKQLPMMLKASKRTDQEIGLRLSYIKNPIRESCQTERFSLFSNFGSMPTRISEHAMASFGIGDSITIEYLSKLILERSSYSTNKDNFNYETVIGVKTAELIQAFMKDNVKVYYFGVNSQQNLFFEYNIFARMTDTEPIGVMRLVTYRGIGEDLHID